MESCGFNVMRRDTWGRLALHRMDTCRRCTRRTPTRTHHMPTRTHHMPTHTHRMLMGTLPMPTRIHPTLTSILSTCVGTPLCIQMRHQHRASHRASRLCRPMQPTNTQPLIRIRHTIIIAINPLLSAIISIIPLPCSTSCTQEMLHILPFLCTSFIRIILRLFCSVGFLWAWLHLVRLPVKTAMYQVRLRLPPAEKPPRKVQDLRSPCDQST